MSVRLEVREGVARLTLDAPPLNILTTSLMETLRGRLDALRGEPGVRCLLLDGAGKCFSAGADVSEHEGERLAPMLKAFHAVFLALRDLDLPLVTAVKGASLGGGAELACFADLVVLGRSAKLGFPEIRLGAFPPVAAALLPVRIGAARTRDLLLTGRAVDAEEALRMGLAARVVDDAVLDEAAWKEASSLAALSASSMKVLREALRIGEMESFRNLLQEEEGLYLGRLAATKDAHEGIRAFLEKRAPRWSHR